MKLQMKVFFVSHALILIFYSSLQAHQSDTTLATLTLYHDIAKPTSTLALHSSSKNLEETPKISFIDSLAVIMEYNSVYDVHNQWDSINYPNIRAAPGNFNTQVIMQDLETQIDPSRYSFVLLYTIKEVPGWIKGGNGFGIPAKNIGWTNIFADPDINGYKNWKKLRTLPHMNSVKFLNLGEGGSLPNSFGTLIAFHEIFHYWGVYIIHNYSIGFQEWNPTYPLAYLAGANSHWSLTPWNDLDKMPGIMYSGPQNTIFNAYDLYIMGLMGYQEASTYIYQMHDLQNNNYQFHLDDLIYALSLSGSDFYEGDGKRIPDLDPSVKSLRTLVVVIKGKDEAISQEDKDRVIKLARDIPSDWEEATWGRSHMTAGVDISIQPIAPMVVSITQPTCSEATGSVVLSSLPATGQWTLKRYPGGVTTSGTGSSSTIAALSTGTYSFTVTNSLGRTSPESGNVVINIQPEIPPAPSIVQNGNILTSSSVSGNQWYSTSSGLISGATGLNYTIITDGNYYVIVTKNGCASAPSNIISFTTNLERNKEFEGTFVYPNPANETLYIENDNSTVPIDFDIVNTNGKSMYNSTLYNKCEIDLTRYKSGIYYIRFTKQGASQNLKFIKN